MTDQPVASGNPPKSDRPTGERIAKLLARAGVASRREIERMIDDGRVALDGIVLDTPATILTSLRGVTVDGHPVAPPEAARLFVFHKPSGYLVTEHDPAGRPIIYDRLPDDLPRVVPVGRLDLATEGLLLLTTDGGLKRQLELPATGVERTYRARAYGDVTQAMLEDLMDGIEIDGVRYGPIDANLERRTGANVWIELTLTEGKNREVRNVLEHLGLQVGRLIRTRYGPFVLGDLPPGEIGEVKQHDLVAFSKSLGGGRRTKGADLDALVSVEARKVAAPPPPPSPPPPRVDERPARAAAPRETKPTRASGGWGSRARPSRPTAPSDQPRGRFRLSDERSGGEQRPSRAPTSGDRAARPFRSGDDQRPRREPVDERPPSARRDRDSDQRRARPSRTDTDPRGARRDDDRGDAPRDPRAGTLSPTKPAKGPAGGRGRPPRESDDRPRGGAPARPGKPRGDGPPRSPGTPPKSPRGRR